MSAVLGLAPPERVAVPLVWRGRVALFQPTRSSGRRPGGWQCLNAAVAAREDSVVAAAGVLLARTGLAVHHLVCLRPGPVLSLQDGGRTVRFRTVLAETDRRRLPCCEEGLEHRWVRPDRLSRFDGQPWWLRPVVDAVLAEVSVTHASAAADGIAG